MLAAAAIIGDSFGPHITGLLPDIIDAGQAETPAGALTEEWPFQVGAPAPPITAVIVGKTRLPMRADDIGIVHKHAGLRPIRILGVGNPQALARAQKVRIGDAGIGGIFTTRPCNTQGRKQRPGIPGQDTHLHLIPTQAGNPHPGSCQILLLPQDPLRLFQQPGAVGVALNKHQLGTKGRLPGRCVECIEGAVKEVILRWVAGSKNGALNDSNAANFRTRGNHEIALARQLIPWFVQINHFRLDVTDSTRLVWRLGPECRTGQNQAGRQQPHPAHDHCFADCPYCHIPPMKPPTWRKLIKGFIRSYTSLAMPVAPFFTLGTYYAAARYFYVHRRSHLKPEWGKKAIPWHYDHHMNTNQDANWCVTRPWFDYIMGTRVIANKAMAESNPLGIRLPEIVEKPLNQACRRLFPKSFERLNQGQLV